MKNSPWRDGRGDVVGDFVASCRKYGVSPGPYWSMATNAYLGVDDPGRVLTGDPEEQKRYVAIYEQLIRELWSRYGELGEIWFDGDILPPDEGGLDVGPILAELQPNAAVFQSQYANIRWMGSETGIAPDPQWHTVPSLPKPDPAGDPSGSIWCPGECDTTLHHPNEWFHVPKERRVTKSVDHLFSVYLRSVGRGCNLILNSAPGPDGLIPEGDMQIYRDLGDRINDAFSSPSATASGQGDVLSVHFDGPTTVDAVELMEDIAHGQRIRRYVLEGYLSAGAWWTDNHIELCRGRSVGHKRIDTFLPVEVEGVRLRVLESEGEPRIRSMRTFDRVQRR